MMKALSKSWSFSSCSYLITPCEAYDHLVFVCQVAVPLGKHDSYPISVSFIAAHGSDKFLLDTVSDMHSSLQEQIDAASNLVPTQDINGDMDVSELLKEKVSFLLSIF